MSRYRVPTGAEVEYENGSRRRVLKNLLGISSKMEMDRVESCALDKAQRDYYTGNTLTSDTRFTAELLRRMHGDWLRDIYAWAGCYRTLDLSKGGFMFPPAYLIPENMERFEREILAQHTPCRPASLEQVCNSLATVHAELLLIHPFREGNGRLARWLADTMAVQARLPVLDYGFTGAGAKANRQGYLSAVIKGYARDYADLEAFFERCIRRSLEG